MHTMRRLILGGAAAAAAVVLTAGPGLAHECINASRNGAAGAQLVFGMNDEVVWMSKGLEFDRVVVVEPAAIAAAEPDQRTGLRRLYVVLTRAVSALTVVHAQPLPAELAQVA